jgi:hypothetical protein
MRKLSWLVLVGLLLISLAACGDSSDEEYIYDDVDTEETEDTYGDTPSDDPADYNSDGEYEPVEDMTQDEIEEELTEMLDESLNGQ